MSLAGSIRGLGKFFNLAGRSTPRTIAALRRNVSGQYIDEDTALTFSAYFACIRVISEDIAGFPWHVHEHGADGRRTMLPGSRVGRLLRVRPNPEQTAYNARQALLFAAIGWGNGYAEIERDISNRPTALWPIHPRRVRVERDDTGQLVYRVSNERAADTFLKARDMFHVMGPTEDGSIGLSVAALARNTVGLGVAAEQYGSSLFGNGANPGGVLEYPGVLGENARNNLRASWEAMHRGSDSANRVAILEEGLKFTTTSVPPEDAQFLETRNFQIEDVVRWFRVPPHKVQHLLRATFNNIEQLNLNYLSDALLPWIIRLEQEADAKLLNVPNQFTKLDIRGLLRADSKTRGEFYTRMFQLGMSINEIRALEDADPIGPDGDARFVPVNLQTIDRAIEPPEPPPPPPAPELEPEADDADEVDDDGDGAAVADNAFVSMLQVALNRCDRRLEHRRSAGHADEHFLAQHLDYTANQIGEVLAAFGVDSPAYHWAQTYAAGRMPAAQLKGAMNVQG